MDSVNNVYGGPYTVRSTVDNKNYVFQVGVNIKCETKIYATEKTFRFRESNN